MKTELKIHGQTHSESPESQCSSVLTSRPGRKREKQCPELVKVQLVLVIVRPAGVKLVWGVHVLVCAPVAGGKVLFLVETQTQIGGQPRHSLYTT